MCRITEKKMEEKKKPVKKFRAGQIVVSVWQNENTNTNGEKFETKSATFDKSYKDIDGEWKNTNILRADDIARTILALSEAYKFMVMDKDS